MKRVVIEFFGGCWDGRALDSGSEDSDERKLAHSCYFKTGDGTIGEKIAALPPLAEDFAARRQWTAPEGVNGGESSYHVVEKVDEAERIVVKMRHPDH